MVENFRNLYYCEEIIDTPVIFWCIIYTFLRVMFTAYLRSMNGGPVVRPDGWGCCTDAVACSVFPLINWTSIQNERFFEKGCWEYF